MKFCNQHKIWSWKKLILFLSVVGPSYINKGLSHCGLAIYIKKYLKAKEELWKLKYFTMQKL
jgi:hypothetical protein